MRATANIVMEDKICISFLVNPTYFSCDQAGFSYLIISWLLLAENACSTKGFVVSTEQ